jgi:hypothetical protein
MIRAFEQLPHLRDRILWCDRERKTSGRSKKLYLNQEADRLHRVCPGSWRRR